jgi:hypothetical protein
MKPYKTIKKTLMSEKDEKFLNETLIELIKDWPKYHHGQRFGQWLWNTLYFNQSNPELFFIEDKEIIKEIRK